MYFNYQVIQLSMVWHCFRSVLIKWPDSSRAYTLVTELECLLVHGPWSIVYYLYPTYHSGMFDILNTKVHTDIITAQMLFCLEIDQESVNS